MRRIIRHTVRIKTMNDIEFKKLFHGVYDFLTCENGYTSFSRYSAEQREYLRFNDFFFVRTTFDGSVTLEFTTCATDFGFEYKILGVSSKDTFDLYVNGELAVQNKVAELSEEGKLDYRLESGEKKVVLYFPIDADIAVKNFYSDKPCNAVKKGCRVLFVGDSITQGYGTFETGKTFVNAANRILGYELLNQGVGGYYFDKNSLMPLEKFVPDKVVVAMGTNLCYWDDKEKYVAGFFEKLPFVYPDVPVLAVTPLWRADYPDAFDEVRKVRDLIEKYSSPLKNVTVIHGDELIPHDEKYFYDKLHPNAVGGEIYGKNFAAKVKEIKF